MDGMESMGVNWKDYSTMDFKDGGMDGFNEDVSMDGNFQAQSHLNVGFLWMQHLPCTVLEKVLEDLRIAPSCGVS